ncbi:MAG: thiolase family protein [bacterium]|nr:thiolase family protein [bacterium]
MKVFYIDGIRTPFGSLGGTLSTLSAPQLAAPLLGSLIQRNDLGPKAIDEVVLGQVIQAGSGQAPARQAMRLAGLDDATAAMTINKVCGSGLKSLMLGGASILTSESRLVLAGGMESMSQAPHGLLKARAGLRSGDKPLVDLLFHDALTDPDSGQPMGWLVEQQLKGKQISRDAQDEFCLRSYQAALDAQRNGRLAKEILPITIEDRKGYMVVDTDEEPGKVKFDKIPQLKPVFDPQGSLTAANSSSINDGAAAVLLASEAEAQARGLVPKAELVCWATASLAPKDFTLAPIPAIQRVLEKARLKIKDIDLFEINEAFAAVPLLAIGALALDPRRLNVNGGAVALGHPVGASGARLVVTLVEELIQRQARYGIVALCIGGGEAVAALFKRWEG